MLYKSNFYQSQFDERFNQDPTSSTFFRTQTIFVLNNSNFKPNKLFGLLLKKVSQQLLVPVTLLTRLRRSAKSSLWLCIYEMLLSWKKHWNSFKLGKLPISIKHMENLICGKGGAKTISNPWNAQKAKSKKGCMTNSHARREGYKTISIPWNAPKAKCIFKYLDAIASLAVRAWLPLTHIKHHSRWLFRNSIKNRVELIIACLFTHHHGVNTSSCIFSSTS